jgi:hypothetical protein
MNSALTTRLDVVFDPVDYRIQRGAGQKYLFDSQLLEHGAVSIIKLLFNNVSSY